MTGFVQMGHKLPCIVQSSTRSCRSTSWLVSIVVFSCHMVGLQVVTREVHRSSLRRLFCPAQDHFIFLTLLIISMTFILSLTEKLVFLSLYVMLNILLSSFVCALDHAISFQRCHRVLPSRARTTYAESTIYTIPFVPSI